MKQDVSCGLFRICKISLVFSLLLPALASAAPPASVDQGTDWNAPEAQDFYSHDQGSQLIPLKWIAALKQANGKPFLADSLSRYGYLPNPSDPKGLPVGFTVNRGGSNGQELGMSCAACHTREIQANGNSYRIDGGPAIVDFQAFLTDLDKAVAEVLTKPGALADFSQSVLDTSPTAADENSLKEAVTTWYTPFHTIVDRALPREPWGLGRVDAVGMIFDRLTGLDIGTSPDHMIPENMRRATAPVRYPFLWNAPMQDWTQWLRFAPNDTVTTALARNLGQVYGVFAKFHPKRVPATKHLLGFDYQTENSADFQGLKNLEQLVQKIGPPKWPWNVDQSLADAGSHVYEKYCESCHAVPEDNKAYGTWKTPLVDAGTDSKQHELLGWTAKTGVLERAGFVLGGEERLEDKDTDIRILTTAVTGSIVQYYIPISANAVSRASPAEYQKLLMSKPNYKLTAKDLERELEAVPPASTASFPYEARVLKGIWAAAPYLHNGSVPTLTELLKPSADRVPTFEVGADYDSVTVGLAEHQTGLRYVMHTTDCSQRNSGNSRCGHDYGTTLTPDEKKALLEYLKTL